MTTTPARHPAPAAVSPRQAIHPRRGISAKAVGSFVPRLTAKAFQKYGFSAASLITDWPIIAGPELAHYTAPERLKWPRHVDLADDDTREPAHGRPGATLVLRVDGARALDVQYRGRQIIDRINAYFGYSAVAELRIIQAPVTALGPIRRAGKTQPQPLTSEVSGIGDAALRDALARLGAGVRAAR